MATNYVYTDENGVSFNVVYWEDTPIETEISTASITWDTEYKNVGMLEFIRSGHYTSQKTGALVFVF